MFSEVISTAIDNNTQHAVINDNDYYAPCFEDEPELVVLYCGECGQKKEFYPYISTVPLDVGTAAPRKYRRYFMSNDSPRKVAVSCACMRKKNSSDLSEKQLKIRSRELKRKCWGYCNEEGIKVSNKKMEGTTFDKYQPNRHIEKASGYLNSFSEMLSAHKGLTLVGRAGAGKTIALMCLANALMDRGVDVLFKQQSQITSLSQFDDKAELEELQNCTVLIIDDLSLKSLSEYGVQLLFNLIELRIKRGLITCYTSNISAAKIKNPPNTSVKRIYDRINHSTYVVEDSTNNYRV